MVEEMCWWQTRKYEWKCGKEEKRVSSRSDLSNLWFILFLLFFFFDSLKSDLINLEKQIFDLETSYLEDTRNIGNIFIGWGSYSNNSNGSDRSNKKKKIIPNEER